MKQANVLLSFDFSFNSINVKLVSSNNSFINEYIMLSNIVIYNLINIYDITGSVVETVINEKIESGHHEIQWNVTASSSGVYFVELRIGEKRLVQKLLYIK